jgi:predicted glycosyltransferase
MKTTQLTVVGYAVNGSGLGHLTRCVAIFRWMRRLAKLSGVQLDAHILTSSEAPGLAFEEGFASWKIPSKTIVKETEIDKAAFLRLARQWVWHTLGLINPDILLVDTFPAGSFGELLYALDGPGKKVLVRRAVKNSFEAQMGVAQLLRAYNLILVPTENGTTAQSNTEGVDERTRYLGPIMLRSCEENRPRAQARLRLGVPEGKLAVYLSAGGGGDSNAGTSLEAMTDALNEDAGLHLVVGAGPLYRGAPRRAQNITWLTSFKAAEDFAALDLAVSAAGFNSYHELLNAGVPTAFFSQEKIADEQCARVRRAVEAGAAISCLPGEVRQAVTLLAGDENLRARLAKNARDFVPENYAREAAFETLSTVLGAERLREAMTVGTPSFFKRLRETGATIEDVRNAGRHIPENSYADPGERAAIALDLFEAGGVPPGFAALVCKDFCALFPPPADEAEAADYITAARQLAEALFPFGAVEAARGLINSLAPLAAGRDPRICAREWAEKLRNWWDEGESAASIKTKLSEGGPHFPHPAQKQALFAAENS